MTDILSNVVQFFRSRKVAANVWPEIRVDYDRSYIWDEAVKVVLREQWEQLRAELAKNPSVIKSQGWNEYREGQRQEELVLEIEGVNFKIHGPYYPNPAYQRPTPPPPKTPEQQGNETIDNFLQSTNILWGLTHCSDDKFNTLIEFMRATRRSGLKE